ncbi:unnamed protein product [Bursaphelenchus xylophilus]|uniref:(pine wood nematode) hypothetical protein n=1 Tax=Bursaphelenchus xylophilus TaxID=6326 RepID=A0A7I8WVQ0_BURXY|nr:unnamed protein product [Bursaphelenchus xylophilus]CAG9117925.1 unnamed protein product [Bursaphelenchus xylophilus]
MPESQGLGRNSEGTYNGEKQNSPVSQLFRGVTFKGDTYKGTLIFGNVKGEQEIKAVGSIEGGAPIALRQDAVLGLNFGAQLSTGYAINQLLSRAPAGKKSVIFRRGPFVQQLKTEEFRLPRGSFVIGDDQLSGCGNFTYQDTIDQSGWNIKAKVKIGDVQLDEQTISFSFDKTFTVPTEHIDKFKGKTEETLPEFSIEFNNKQFALNKENLQDYRDVRHEVLTVLVEEENRDSFLLGKNFLKDYCIALRAKDDALTKFEVGLAPFEKLNSDQKWSSYDKGKSSKHEYSGETPLLDLKFKKDVPDESASKAILTLAETQTFALETGCAAKDTCTKYQHDNVYDPKKYSGVDDNTPFEVKYKDSTLKGKTYNTTFIAGNFEGMLHVSTVSEITGDPVDLSADAVLGLAFTETSTFAMTTFLNKAPSDKKNIIVRRGPFVQKLKDQEIKEAKGTIFIGEYTKGVAGCGDFVWRDTISKEGWTIKADVKIEGMDTLKDQKIAFSFDELFTVPEAQFALFKDKLESELPDITIIFDDADKFVLSKQNLKSFDDDKHEKLSLLVRGETRDSFLLGRNFLSDFCIAFSADNKLSTFQIGLAPITRLDSDSKWIKYDDGKGEDDGNGEDGGKGGKDKDKDKDGKGAFTASSSLALQVFCALATAFIARLAQ